MKKEWFVLGIVILLVPWLVVGCGISEEVYNTVVAERDAVQAQVTNLESDVSVIQAKYDDLKTDNDELKSEFETMQAKYEELSAEYEELDKQFEELSKEGDIIIEEINAEDAEQTLFTLINQERKNNGLDELMWGKYLYKEATTNSHNMATSGQLEYPSRACWKEVYRAAGHSTTDGMANAVFTIWKNSGSYEENILDIAAKYGAVAVNKSGETFYITYMADYYH
jgi:uncharacterized protein YkwD